MANGLQQGPRIPIEEVTHCGEEWSLVPGCPSPSVTSELQWAILSTADGNCILGPADDSPHNPDKSLSWFTVQGETAFQNWKGKIKSSVSRSLEIDKRATFQSQFFPSNSIREHLSRGGTGAIISSWGNGRLGFKSHPYLLDGVQLPLPKLCFLQLCSWPFMCKCCFYTSNNGTNLDVSLASLSLGSLGSLAQTIACLELSSLSLCRLPSLSSSCQRLVAFTWHGFSWKTQLSHLHQMFEELSISQSMWPSTVLVALNLLPFFHILFPEWGQSSLAEGALFSPPPLLSDFF